MEQLLMRRPNLDGLPEPPMLDGGYVLRLGTPEDAESMGVMMTRAYLEPWDADKCRSVLLCHPKVSATFQIEHEGLIVATASCLELDDRPQVGYVHFVGAEPEQSGKRLGLAVTLATMRQFVRQGKTEAILNTDDHRLPAIRTYLKLGFVPVCVDESHVVRWSAIFPRLLGARP